MGNVNEGARMGSFVPKMSANNNEINENDTCEETDGKRCKDGGQQCNDEYSLCIPKRLIGALPEHCKPRTECF